MVVMVLGSSAGKTLITYYQSEQERYGEGKTK
jgi:hypothetical protein